MNEALILLVLVWAVLLIPSALRSRSSTSPHVTVGRFKHAMDVLKSSPSRDAKRGGERSLLVPVDAGRIVQRADLSDEQHPDARQPDARHDAAGRPAVTHREDPAIAARRSWFLRLLAAAGVSVVAAPLLGGAAWVLALLAVAATAGYAVLLRRWKVQRDEVRAVVRELEPVRRAEHGPVGAAVAGGGGGTGGDAAAGGAVRLRRWDG